jgi:hypothetical protein
MRALGLTQPQMDARALWEVKAACVKLLHHQRNVPLMPMKNMVTNTIFFVCHLGLTYVKGITLHWRLCIITVTIYPVQQPHYTTAH